jgi:hypothetical protein
VDIRGNILFCITGGSAANVDFYYFVLDNEEKERRKRLDNE